MVLTQAAVTGAKGAFSSLSAPSRWMRPVYIRSTGAFFPNDPVPNDQIDTHIGSIHSQRSAMIREKILSLNGIKNRYYAMRDGKPTHLNMDLGAEAVHDGLRNSSGITLKDVGMLATGTTMPDVLMPGFANLLHGNLGTSHSMDCLTSSGVCISSTNALKAAANAVSLGAHERALVVGSEASSHMANAERFAKFNTDDTGVIDPKDAFKAEFLRYMLSDGAASLLLDTQPHPNKLSYRIESFYHHSFAHKLPPCMVLGVREAGKPIALEDTFKFNGNDFMNVLQDTNLLNKEVIKRTGEALKCARDEGHVDDIDYVLPHMSSSYFENSLNELWKDILGVPEEKVWTNLENVGNVGAASPFLLLWGALNNNNPDAPNLKAGDRVMVFVPESGNFSYQFFVVTVVDASG